MKQASRRRGIRCGVMAAVVGMLFSSSNPRALAQTENADASLRNRTSQLIERLDAPEQQAADLAQAELIKLGAPILPLLPDPSGVASPEQEAVGEDS